MQSFLPAGMIFWVIYYHYYRRYSLKMPIKNGPSLVTTMSMSALVAVAVVDLGDCY
jgi:hypothetical protein